MSEFKFPTWSVPSSEQPPAPPPPAPNPAMVERQLWASRNSRNPVAVLADAFTQVLGQPPDYDTIDQLLSQGGIDDALRTLLSQRQDSLVQGTSALPTSFVQRAILGSYRGPTRPNANKTLMAPPPIIRMGPVATATGLGSRISGGKARMPKCAQPTDVCSIETRRIARLNRIWQAAMTT